MSPRPFRAVTVAAAVLAALAAFAAPGSSAAEPSAEPGPAPAAAPGPPVLDVNFPDPDIVRAGGTYHAYATNGAGKNIQHATSTDLASWSLDADDVLPRLGDWAAPDQGLVWAPEVFDNGAGFTMHYTARDRASDKQCIGVALAATPEGPFEPAGRGPLVCPERQGGAIDASSYTEGGQRYMLWKNDGNCCSTDTWLYVQPMNADGTVVRGRPTPLIRQDRAWEGNVIEAPTLVKRNGRYVLLYSASFYDGNRYKTGYAVADRLTGPYTKVADPLLSTDTFGGAVRGPGGQDVVTGPDGRDRILFHGWSADRSRRAMYATGIGWAGGRPVVEGSKVLYQAENAVVNNARIRDAAGAHDGGAVGHIDYANSYVEFSVFAPAAGHRTLSVRYANGSLAGSAPVTSSHLLTVGGKAAGRVDYPFTGWEKWATVDQRVRLDAGWNTVRLARGTYYAELDSIEIT
ncbi:family 43 glycosylhydrolase [Streptomyces sp. WAC 06738]|uniref:family 43 glycosylhydrolase n=1 Tax=Streptomyces sp. WAC 06738 TaxID=2203210 RepID=UPI001F0C7603|nr:family 43 glycosylhydrolase [Streptomyces sp. WAC 06738]